MTIDRHILHIDMDAFFAAIEQMDHVELRGKPVLVGHDGPRGVVATASYEARPFGCHSAMPMAVAKRLCPQSVVVPARGDRYRDVSHKLFAILDEFSPLVEPLSIDEAFLDVTGNDRLFGPATDTARQIKDRIRTELGLSASVGVAANKFLAKLASDLNKPDGLTVIWPKDVETVLPSLPVTKIWGIGHATAAKLERMDVRTIDDLRIRSQQWLERHFGAEAERYYRLARGIDDRPVIADREAKSIGHEQTFEVDLAQRDEVRRILLAQVEQVTRRLRNSGLMARSVSLKIRFGEFETINRSSTLKSPTDGTNEIWQVAKGLFDKWAKGSFQPVRLIGVMAAQLRGAERQMGLFPDPERLRQKRVDQAADRIAEKFGKSAVRRGGTL